MAKEQDGAREPEQQDAKPEQDGAGAQAGAEARGASEGAAQERGGAPEDGIKDAHGQPGINKERHDKEVAALNAKIEELQGRLDESAKTEKARADLKAEIEKVRTEIDGERVAWQLEKAGCRNVKAAKALLGDYDGDVARLKAECPYLFEEDVPKGATGGKPAGAAGGESLAAKAARAAGLPEGTKLE